MKTKRALSDFWTDGCEVRGPDDHWPAKGRLTPKGYGQFWCDGRRRQSHVVAWELTNGPVPDGLQVDHLCRRRYCCNPAHLEPVTGLINTRRSPTHNASKTCCPAGHNYAVYGVTYLQRRRDGRMQATRRCRKCRHPQAYQREAA